MWDTDKNVLSIRCASSPIGATEPPSQVSRLRQFAHCINCKNKGRYCCYREPCYLSPPNFLQLSMLLSLRLLKLTLPARTTPQSVIFFLDLQGSVPACQPLLTLVACNNKFVLTKGSQREIFQPQNAWHPLSIYLEDAFTNQKGSARMFKVKPHLNGPLKTCSKNKTNSKM